MTRIRIENVIVRLKQQKSIHCIDNETSPSIQKISNEIIYFKYMNTNDETKYCLLRDSITNTIQKKTKELRIHIYMICRQVKYFFFYSSLT